MNKDKMQKLEIPESTLSAIRDAQHAYQNFSKNLQSLIPKIPEISLPKFEFPEIIKPEDRVIPTIRNLDEMKEKNAWKRHTETVDIQTSLLKIMSQLLDNQQSTDKLSKWIFKLTIIGTFIALASLVLAAITLWNQI